MPAAPNSNAAVPLTSPATPTFFAVGLVKLLVMSVATAGLYELYWFYRNWQHIRDREKPGIWPVWRTVFSVVFCLPCLAAIGRTGRDLGVPPAVPAWALAVGWVVAVVASQLNPPWMFMTLLSGLFLLPMQACANRINAIAAPTHTRNAGLSRWNWAAVVVGTTILVLAALGAWMQTQTG
jgi:hypothetical protein